MGNAIPNWQYGARTDELTLLQAKCVSYGRPVRQRGQRRLGIGPPILTSPWDGGKGGGMFPFVQIRRCIQSELI
jgi:hypothetical protein